MRVMRELDSRACWTLIVVALVGCDAVHLRQQHSCNSRLRLPGARDKNLLTQIFVSPVADLVPQLYNPNSQSRNEAVVSLLRFREQLEVLKHHHDSGLFERIYVLVEDSATHQQLSAVLEDLGLCVDAVLVVGAKFSYRHVFKLCHSLGPGLLCVYAHADVYIGTNVGRLSTLDPGHVLALARIEMFHECHVPTLRPDGDRDCRDMFRRGSFDTVIFNSTLPVGVSLPDLLKRMDFTVNTLGVENMLTQVLDGFGYKIWSPCNFFRTYHRHCSFLRPREHADRLDTTRWKNVVINTYVETPGAEHGLLLLAP